MQEGDVRRDAGLGFWVWNGTFRFDWLFGDVPWFRLGKGRSWGRAGGR